MDSKQLLTAVRAAQGIPSNYRLARVLGISDNTVQRWNTCANTPDDLTAARLATLAGLDPDAVVAAMHAQRAAEPAERALWERMAARLQAPAGAAAALAMSLFIGGGPNGGAMAAAPSPAASPVVVCILC